MVLDQKTERLAKISLISKLNMTTGDAQNASSLFGEDGFESVMDLKLFTH